MESFNNAELLGGGYHRLTAYDRQTLSGHGLNWANQPKVDKAYPGRPVIELPPLAEWGGVDLFQALKGAGPGQSPPPAGLEGLAALLRLTNTVTARARSAGGDFFYRSAPSAGALYPNELYLVSRGWAGLADGVYHYSVQRAQLTLLRDDLPPGPAGLGLILSAIIFRSAWKYAGRAYRYCLLDGGHIQGNFRAAAGALGLDFKTWPGEEGVARPDLETPLGLDPEREIMLQAWTTSPDLVADLSALGLPPEAARLVLASRVAVRENGPELPLAAHRAGEAAGEGWAATAENLGSEVDHWLELGPPGQGQAPPELVRALAERRSKRNFVPSALAEPVWRTLVDSLRTTGPEPDWPEVYLACRGLDGLADGVWLLERRGGRLGLIMIRAGEVMEPLARACLDQMWLANCSLILALASDLDALAERLGPGAYRRTMLAAGELSQRLQLTAAGLGLGSCGIGAFYDDEAAGVLGLPPQVQPLYFNGLGRVKRL